MLSWYLLPVSKLSGALWRWGQEKEGALATTSLEFEHLHWKSWCEMLISGDHISNDVIAHAITVISAAIKRLDPPKSLLLPLISPWLLWEKQLVVHMMKIAWWWRWEDYTLRWLPLVLFASGFFEVGGQTRWQMHQHPSVGVTDSFLSVSHITQTRQAHQVTAACLHIPMKKAYEEFTTADLVTCLSPAYNQPVFALRQLERVKRLDIGWNVYKDHSLKKATREKWGSW